MDVNVSLRRNAFLSADNTLVLSLFGERHSEFEVYLRTEVGAAISFTRTTAPRFPLTLGLPDRGRHDHCQSGVLLRLLQHLRAGGDRGARKRRRVRAPSRSALQRQRLNNPLDPLRGSVLSASVTTSSQLLGSSATQQFTRFIGDAAGFIPVTRSVVLAGHLRGGIILAPVTDIDTDVGNFVPPDQRFYAGGANDVRGYDQNQLGPLVYVIPSDSIVHAVGHDSFPSSATRVAPTGGTRVLIANLEVRLPTPLFAGRLRYAVFVDGGALWNAGGQAPFRITPGAGLRYASPLGPIRFDVGYNTYPLQSGTLYQISTDGTLRPSLTSFVQERTSNWTLHFSIGQPFP